MSRISTPPMTAFPAAWAAGSGQPGSVACPAAAPATSVPGYAAAPAVAGAGGSAARAARLRLSGSTTSKLVCSLTRVVSWPGVSRYGLVSTSPGWRPAASRTASWAAAALVTAVTGWPRRPRIWASARVPWPAGLAGFR